jgi:hypothetical protein
MSSTPDGLMERRRSAALHLSTQAQWCHGLGSPLYGALLERAAADCESGGVTWSILEAHAQEPLAAAVALRFMGGVHRLVLEGEAAALARHYPSAGGSVGDLDDAWRVLRQTLVHHEARLRLSMPSPVQTNEVGRSGVLLGGFLEIACHTGLPLRLLEIGASAGLNLRWDFYRYESGGGAWGDAQSPVRFAPTFEGVHPTLDVRAEIVERRGCDLCPLDPGSAADRTTLRAYLWPDHIARRQRLDGALRIAQSVPADVESVCAGDWLETELAQSRTGVATVVFHSIMMQYVARDERARILETLRAAGSRATTRAPLAWLRFEPVKASSETTYRLDLTLWPGGEMQSLAVASPHGPPVRWL